MSRLPHLLHPRLTWRYTLCALSLSYIFYCYFFNMPLLSSDLPPYTGPYSVGAIDLEAPCESRTIHDAIYKDSGEPAFKLDTVLFTLYYPSERGAVSSHPHHSWITKPAALTAEGYARFAGINNYFTNSFFSFGLWGLAGSTTIPAEVDVPLEGSKEEPNDESRAKTTTTNADKERFPVVVFSHGMASSRTSYTQYCGELASRGYVVAAVEHRDGSGPGTAIMRRGEPARKVFHITLDQLK